MATNITEEINLAQPKKLPVDDRLWRRLKANAALRGKTLTEALNDAIEMYVSAAPRA